MTADVTDAGRQPTLEVVAYRDGDELARQFVESEEEAALVAAEWSELEGVHCEVLDIGGRDSDDVTDLDPAPLDDESEGV